MSENWQRIPPTPSSFRPTERAASLLTTPTPSGRPTTALDRNQGRGRDPVRRRTQRLPFTALETETVFDPARPQATGAPQARSAGGRLPADRVAENRWDNVHIVIGDAATAPLPADVDSALFFLVHDLVRSRAVVDRMVGACRPGARVVAFGPKWAPRWAWPLNAFVRRGIRPYVTTFEGLDAPWDHLQHRLNQFSVRPLALGTLYLAEGSVAS